MKRKKKQNFKSNITFDRKTAIRLCKVKYYKAQAKNMAAYAYIEKEKIRLSTPRREVITELLEGYRQLGEDGWASNPALTLLGIYNKNKAQAQLLRENKLSDTLTTTDSVVNSKLLKLVSHPEMLLLAYKTIKGNKGAMTEAAKQSLQKINTYTDKQLKVYYNSLQFPDKFSLRDVFLVSELLRKGLYPWGSSLRVYVPKPGVKDKMRPITIPPFLDRVVQKTISMVLEAVYEPYFEIRNRSFGFRPNKGCHDAITALTSTYSSGKVTAIEGDIEAAYDTVNKEKLIHILGKKIKDRKFLQLIQDRLDYDFVEYTGEGEQRVRPPMGIPQGGVDSPYLFNIYMNELDEFVHTEIQSLLDKMNERLTVKRSFKRLYNQFKAQDEKAARCRAGIKKELKQLRVLDKVQELKRELYSNIKDTRLTRHNRNRIKSEHQHRKNLGFLYVRYADDWILVTNGDLQIAEKIKRLIKNFLWEKLELKLSEKKTTITDIRKMPARFLGFELRHAKMAPLKREQAKTKHANPKHKMNTARARGSTIIWATIDTQRLIDRLHMKGFCTRYGFPKELPWLSTLEPHVIIERYNATMRGLAQYYYGFIRNNSDLQRWLYILRFSCIKTLAQKYRTSIKGIFKKFGINPTSKGNRTVKVTVRLKVRDDVYERDWTLWSYSALMKELKKSDLRKNKVQINFWKIEKTSQIGEYPWKMGKVPTVTNQEYLNRISWVSLRTQASFAMPCANCGTDENVHQHHIKHIRKTAFELLPDSMPYQKVMALRNRKQIPLCAQCHRNLVHAGQYSGNALLKLVPQKLMDNRIVHVESFVHPGVEYNSKSLEEKGWKRVSKDTQKDSVYEEQKI